MGWANHAVRVPKLLRRGVAFPMLDKATPLLDTQVIALDMMG